MTKSDIWREFQKFKVHGEFVNYGLKPGQAGENVHVGTARSVISLLSGNRLPEVLRLTTGSILFETCWNWQHCVLIRLGRSCPYRSQIHSLPQKCTEWSHLVHQIQRFLLVQSHPLSSVDVLNGQIGMARTKILPRDVYLTNSANLFIKRRTKSNDRICCSTTAVSFFLNNSKKNIICKLYHHKFSAATKITRERQLHVVGNEQQSDFVDWITCMQRYLPLHTSWQYPSVRLKRPSLPHRNRRRPNSYSMARTPKNFK